MNNKEETSNTSALRAVPMALFPTMESLQSVVDMGTSQLPITTANGIIGLLMTYHNTLLKIVATDAKYQEELRKYSGGMVAQSPINTTYY